MGDRPFFIRRYLGALWGQCEDSDFCGGTAYNPREEACCPEINQFFNPVTYKCELCPSVPGLPSSAFNYFTQMCCPASNFNFFIGNCCPTNSPVLDEVSKLCVALD